MTGRLNTVQRDQVRGPHGLPLGTQSNGLRDAALGLIGAVLVAAPILAAGTLHIVQSYSEQRQRLADYDTMLHAHERLVAAAPGPALGKEVLVRGRDVFLGTCAACHKADGTGIERLGRNLVESNFVAALDDEHLRSFLVAGRPNAKPTPMPPKGGREDLKDSDLADVVVYLRGLQDPRRMPELPAPQAPVIAAVTEADKAKALQAAGGDAELAGYIAHGAKVYASTCITCHGPDARGLKGNGKDLIGSDFFKANTDDQMLDFLKKGRAPGESQNTTGIAMPPKGGNPALTDDDLLDVVAYLRSLQKAAGLSTSTQSSVKN